VELYLTSDFPGSLENNLILNFTRITFTPHFSRGMGSKAHAKSEKPRIIDSSPPSKENNVLECF
jgi:hypothetical protein